MKKRMIAIALLILAGIALFVFVSPLKSHKAVSQQDLRDADFLDDKEALLYFSSSADQDAFGGGKSYALFISQNGSLSSFKMKGLELGSAKVHGDSVMLEDKNTIYTIKDGLSSHKRAYQHTGDSAGFLQNTDGFTPSTTQATTKGRRVPFRAIPPDRRRVEKDVIPYYIRASGFHDGVIYALVPTADEKAISSSRFKQIKEAHLSQDNGMAVPGRSLSRIPACCGRSSCVCYGSRPKARNLYQMVKINKKSGEVERTTSPNTKRRTNDIQLHALQL